jgi:hypothetical protein
MLSLQAVKCQDANMYLCLFDQQAGRNVLGSEQVIDNRRLEAAGIAGQPDTRVPAGKSLAQEHEGLLRLNKKFGIPGN